MRDMRIEINKKYGFDEGQYLWKYMDLHRLIYFLNSSNIFFSPLSNFFDPLEGITEEHLQDKFVADTLDEKSRHIKDLNRQSREQINEEKSAVKHRFKTRLEEIQKIYYASCWYLGVRESLAVWDTYSNKDSVAIKFNPQELCRTIINSCELVNDKSFDQMVHGKVEYFQISPFDAANNSLKNCGHKFTGFLKDLSYKHEEEFRFLVKQNNNTEHFDFFELSLNNLKDLDFTILTHPSMESWKYMNIANILKIQGLDDKLERSQIPTRFQVFDTP